MSEAEDRDMLAAEYVLGTLDGAERAAVAARLDWDAALARAVQEWEFRFAPLIAGVAEVQAPDGAYTRIAERLFGSLPPRVERSVTVLQGQLRIWQRATGGLALLAACLMGWIAAREVNRVRDDRGFVAVLQQDAGSSSMVVEVDLAARRLTLLALAAPPPAGRAYELWIIDPTLHAPRSLGVVPPSAPLRESLGSYEASVIAGATYAVTIEAAGGSPTGLPTSPPVLSGRLRPFQS